MSFARGDGKIFLQNPAPASLWLGLFLVIIGIFLVNRPEPKAKKA